MSRLLTDDLPKPVLWEKLGLYGRQGLVYDVKLFQDHLHIVKEDSNGGSPLEVYVKDIIGCHLMKCKDSGDPSAYFIVFAYPERKIFGQSKRRERHTLTFMVNRFSFFDLNLEIANRWKATIMKLKKDRRSVGGVDQSGRPPSLVESGGRSRIKRCLVLLNPFGGKGKALTSFTDQVAPILGEADIHHNMIVTERAGHAQELVQSIALEEWTYILICSGDGLIFEVINGLMRRPDWRRAIQIPIGIIPCGTGNALAASILWRSGESLKSAGLIAAAAFVVTQQLVSPLDLILVETRSSRFYSFLSICYGLIADVDIESEKYRKLGVVRNVLGGLVRILDLRTYRCRLSYLPPSSASTGRVRADSAEKRRHLSDSNLGRRRRSATEEKRSSTTRKHAENASAGADPAGEHPVEPSSSFPPPRRGATLTSSSRIDEDRPAFTYSISVPNGFGSYFGEIADRDEDDADDNANTPVNPDWLMETTTTTPAGTNHPNSRRGSSRSSSLSSFSPPLNDDEFTSSPTTTTTTMRTSPTGNGLQGLEPIEEEGVEVELSSSLSSFSTTSHGEEVNLDAPLSQRDEVQNPDYEKIDLTPTRLSALDADVPPGWITMEPEIVSANIINVSHLSTETVAYTGANIDDGRIFIFIIRAGISKAGLLQMLTAMDSGDTVTINSPYVEMIACDAFRLEPLVEGILTVDGEVIPCAPIQGEVLPGMGRVLVGEDKNGPKIIS